jgi:hypothetical protein
MIKKIIFAGLVLAIAISLGTVETVYASDGPTFSIESNIEAAGGDSLTVPITVSNNPGFASTVLILRYDPNILEISNVTSLYNDMPLSSQFELTTSPGTQWIPLINPGGLDWDGNGAVVNITFDVMIDPPAGTSLLSLSFNNAPDGTPGNASLDILSDALTVSGSVVIEGSVEPVTPGGEAPPETVTPGPVAPPQTGIPGMVVPIIVMGMSLSATILLLTYLFRKRNAR